MAENTERKCWTIQHVFEDSYQNSDRFDTTAIYTTAESALIAIHETIDGLEENILHGKSTPSLSTEKSYFTIDKLNNMIPNNWCNSYIIIYEYTYLSVAVVVRVLV